ncbi:serine hydrolase, partial [Gemmatimonadota bacterium]
MVIPGLLTLRILKVSALAAAVLSGCNTLPPDNQEYIYSTPLQLDDGWAVSSLVQEGMDEQAITGMVNGVCAEYPFIYSVLITRNGKLIFEKYFNGAGRNQLFSIQSSTKSVVSTLIGIALEAGNLNSDLAPIHTLFPDHDNLFNEGREAITIEHLLKMTGGYEWNELAVPYDNPLNDNYRGNSAPNYV